MGLMYQKVLSGGARLLLGLVSLASVSTVCVAEEQGIALKNDSRSSVSSRLLLLGTAGGPVARVKRSQPASMVESGGKIYLVDAGEGVVRQLAAAGVAAGTVGNIFLTHLHLDHTAGLAPLLGFTWVAARKQPISIVGPVGTASFVNSAVAYLSIPIMLHAAQLPPTPSLQELVKVKEIGASGPVEIFADENVTVWALENSHYSEFEVEPPEQTKSYSLKFILPDRTIVFTGDTGPDQRLAEFAKGADLLVSEVINLDQTLAFLQKRYGLPLKKLQAQVAHMSREHMSPEEVGKLASAAGVRTVVLSHIVMGFDDEVNFRPYTDDVRKYFKGPVIVGTDLLQL